MHGLHLLAELHDCQDGLDLLADAGQARGILTAMVSGQGLTVVGQQWHQFHAEPPAADLGGPPVQQAGWTGVILLAESHLAIHTWPERQALTFDVFVCNHSCDNRDKARSLAARLLALWRPRHHVMREVDRRLD